MFWAEPFNDTEAVDNCLRNWGVKPRRHWAVTEFGGRRIRAASNIVFSNVRALGACVGLPRSCALC
jgi:lysosomal Pro-X carboxypeptidase